MRRKRRNTVINDVRYDDRLRAAGNDGRYDYRFSAVLHRFYTEL